MIADRNSTPKDAVEETTIEPRIGGVSEDDDNCKPVCATTAILPNQAGPTLKQDHNTEHPVRRIKQRTSATAQTTDEDDFFCPPSAGDVNIDEASKEDAASVISELTTADIKHDRTATRQAYHFPWSSWSKHRERWTVIGCLSSVAVLTIRLLMDWDPLAYRIHSWVVFFDMVLIHCFTNSVWLSMAGEVATILCFLTFHFTKETVFELAETTLIAVFCSLHMIHSRSKALDKMKHLEEIVEEMSQRQEGSLSSSMRMRSPGQCSISDKAGDMLAKDIQAQDMEEGFSDTGGLKKFRTRSKRCGQNFFEHFLDGSAGVMYTSFVGLIISEMINYGSKSCK